MHGTEDTPTIGPNADRYEASRPAFLIIWPTDNDTERHADFPAAMSRREGQHPPLGGPDGLDKAESRSLLLIFFCPRANLVTHPTPTVRFNAIICYSIIFIFTPSV